MVLWIGYLQWHFRTHGQVNPPQPVIRDFRNIENRDAVLAYDRVEYLTDERGIPVTRWNGVTYKISPVTGEQIPDESARIPVERYVNPRKAEWPAADFVVGNPPFIGASSVRRALGDGYADALRATWPEVPESADFVMHWWHKAADMTRKGELQRFGLITTNSIRQTFNRRVLEAHLAASTNPLSLAFSIPDHPWVDSADGADVRIAMSVGDREQQIGQLLEVRTEQTTTDGEVAVQFRRRSGRVHADLRIGANVASAITLRANAGISCPGFKLHGSGFIVTMEQAIALGFGSAPGLEKHIRHYRNGRDLTDSPRGALVIDLFGLDATDVRTRFPAVYQHVLERVKPERDQNNRATYRENWWTFGEARGAFRPALAGLRCYIATVETSKHRTFQMLDPSVAPDNKLIVIASADPALLAVLSSQSHIGWSLAAGGRLGVGNDPVYVKTRCFECFAFPVLSDQAHDHLRTLGDQLDAHRKRQQAAHPTLTLTGMYNVLEKLRAGEPLTEKERTLHEQGLVSVLRQLHDEIDAAVLDAYGWSDLLPLLRVAHGNTPPAADQRREDAKRTFDESVLERLVALNAERAAEEARGLVRWLRPEFQNPQARQEPEQGRIDVATEEEETIAPVAATKPLPWPKDAVAQVRAVADVIAACPAGLTLAELEGRFTARGPWKRRLPTVLDMLGAVGRVREHEGRYRGA